MKPAAFDYYKATDLDHTLQLLADHQDDARILAGGQSLVPLMAMRLARPEVLIDINDVAELKGIDINDDRITIGAGVRQCELETDIDLMTRVPLLKKALRFIGHQQTRNRGTIGGSLAHADPSAELPLLAVVLDAELELMSKKGRRSINADKFFVDAMETAIRSDECLREIKIPLPQNCYVGYGFQEISIRAGDFAIAAAAVQLELDDENHVKRIAIAISGGSSIPQRLPETEKRLIGKRVQSEMVKTAIRDINDLIDPLDDPMAPADYRRRIIPVLIERALLEANSEASR